MLIGVPTETTAGETRVAVTPETAKKLKAQGHTIRVQAGAGVAASVTDEAYVAAGAEIESLMTDREGVHRPTLVIQLLRLGELPSCFVETVQVQVRHAEIEAYARVLGRLGDAALRRAQQRVRLAVLRERRGRRHSEDDEERGGAREHAS